MDNSKFVYERSPFYYETDKMAVVHHSNYIRWFEEARISFMQYAGFPYDKMESLGVMLPVLSVQCSYRSSVRFGDTVLIEAAVSQFNGFKMSLQYRITDKETGEVRSMGSTSHCFTDMEMKPLRIKKNYPQIYEIFAALGEQTLF